MHDIEVDNEPNRQLMMMKCPISFRTPMARAAAVSLAVIALVMGSALISTTNVTAATGPLTVFGYVYDNLGDPLVGASVVVTIVETSTSDSTTTDGDGFYQIDFDSGQYDVDDTVRTDVTYSAAFATNSTVITVGMESSGMAQVDVHYLIEIPEFGSFAGVAMASIAIGAVAIFSMRKRKS